MSTGYQFYEYREKDYRRIGRCFDSDPFVNDDIDQDWNHLVIHGLNSNKDKNCKEMLRKQFSTQKFNSSIDSGIQQNSDLSDNDDVSNSILMTLNRLKELSREQEIFMSNNNLSCTMEEKIPVPQSCANSAESMSIKSVASEANNLVEEVYMENAACSSNAPGDLLLNGSKNHVAIGARCNSSNLTYNPINSPITSHVLKFDLPSMPEESISTSVLFNSQDEKLEIAEIVIGIDIGCCYSGFGYAYKYNSEIICNTMRKITDNNMKKIPSMLLLNSRTEFHSFGLEALHNYQNMETCGSSQWLFFDKFKSQLKNEMEVNRECIITTVDGISLPAILIYTRTLQYFKHYAMQEISKEIGKNLQKEQIKWVVTIPALWANFGKSFIQEASYNAGLCNPETSHRLLVTYEAEAAANYWINLQEKPIDGNFMVINFGGGSVDITVHELKLSRCVTIAEIHKSKDCINGLIDVENDILQLLSSTFGSDFIFRLKSEKPSSYTNLMMNITSCIISNDENTTRTLSINKDIIDFHHKITGYGIAETIKEYGDDKIGWNGKEITVTEEFVKNILKAALLKIMKAVNVILNGRSDSKKISHLLMIGGFSKMQFLQNSMNENFGDKVKVVMPKLDNELYTLKGAVMRALDEKTTKLHKPPSYAVGVVKPFVADIHPLEKLVINKDGKWCCDILDWLVREDVPLTPGEIILRRYVPSNPKQCKLLINIYSVEHIKSQFVTDNGVHICGVLQLNISSNSTIPHELLLQLLFTGKEFIASILDTVTGQIISTQLDSLSYL